MGLRETLNENRAVATGTAAAVVILAIGFIVYRLAADDARPAERPKQAWFTVDDGATYFAEDVGKEAPFQTADGKTAVKAHVYRCGDGAPFVNHLERRPRGAGVPPAAAAPPADAGKGPEGSPPAATADGDAPPANPYAGVYGKGSTPDVSVRTMMNLIEVKKPGKGEWVPSTDPRAVGILQVACPDGTKTNLEVVHP